MSNINYYNMLYERLQRLKSELQAGEQMIRDLENGNYQKYGFSDPEEAMSFIEYARSRLNEIRREIKKIESELSRVGEERDRVRDVSNVNINMNNMNNFNIGNDNVSVGVSNVNRINVLGNNYVKYERYSDAVRDFIHGKIDLKTLLKIRKELLGY